MNPFYFGSSDRPLFGIYHPPASETVRKSGVVLCPAIGQDYMRTHRGLKQLARQLAKAGFPVLRFDYYGTGDSGGETVDATIEQWLDDIATAIQELQDMADISSVTLIGLRLGGALAAKAAERISTVRSTILWDPVIRGEEYVNQMMQIAEESAEGPFDATADPIGVYGFPLTGALRDGLSTLDLLDSMECEGARDRFRISFLVVSEEEEAYARLRDRLAESAEYAHVPTLSDWNDVERIGAMLLPQQIILTIVDHMDRHA